MRGSRGRLRPAAARPARAGGRSSWGSGWTRSRAERLPAQPRHHGRRGLAGGLRRALLVLAGVVGLGGLGWLATAADELVAGSRLLDVRGVTVRGNSYVTEAGILAQLGPLEGKSLLDVRPGELQARLRAHPRLRGAQVRRGLDRRLTIQVEEREPVALLSTGALVEVDAEGVVLPPVERGALPDLPILVGAAARLPAPGTRLTSPALTGALDLIAGLRRTDPELLAMVSEVDASRCPVYRLHLVGHPQVIVAQPRSLTAGKLSGLRTVLEDLDRRGRRAVEVDLRFAGQLVVRDLP